MKRVYPVATQFKYAATNARPNASNLVIFANRIKNRMIREFAKLKGEKIAVSWSKNGALMCARDRIFDDAMVFNIKGESFRRKKLETVALQTSRVKTQPHLRRLRRKSNTPI